VNASFRNAVRLYNSKRYAMALDEFRKISEDPSSDPELCYYLGLCHTQIGQYEEALIYLEQVVTTDLNILHIYQSRMILSYIYTKTGRLKLAEFELESLLDAGYESAQVYAAFGYVAYRSARPEDAVAHLNKALALDPENVNAMNSLGYVLAEQGKSLDRALTLCRRAVEKKPENPAYLDSLGWVYFKLGRISEARTALRKALSNSGGNKEIAAHMRAALSAKP